MSFSINTIMNFTLVAFYGEKPKKVEGVIIKIQEQIKKIYKNLLLDHPAINR